MTPPQNAEVLIIDDVPANLDLLSSMLTRRGYTIRTAIDPRLGLMSAQVAPPDLILLDISMPEMNGY
ncbi:MAG: response regulator, partial [Anaerolineae bacterium]|nr:response regulator [Anaerolineae bacterium]